MEKKPTEKAVADKNKFELSFRPITDGLGFHPFSDGLPYAPIAKSTSSTSHSNINNTSSLTQGVGATSAGPPVFAHQVKNSPIKNSDVNRPSSSVPRVTVPVASPQEKRISSQPSSITGINIHTPVPPSIHSSLIKPQVNPNRVSDVLPPQKRFGYGYVVRRFFAYFIDVVINLAISVGTLTAVSWITEINIGLLLNENVALVSLVMFVILNWFLIMLQEVTFKTTLGKHIFGLGFNVNGLLLFARALFFIPSCLFFGLGLMWSLVDRQKRCWHDLVVGSQPLI